jgi:flagellar protein FliO/FliZ
MVLVLALVAAAVYGIVFMLKRVARPREGTDPNLKVLSSAYLGSGRYVHVISAGSKAWLVGSADGGVTLIAPLEEKEAVDAMMFENARRAAEGGRGKMPDFRSILRSRGAGAVPDGRPAPENLRNQRERLKGL